MYGGVGVGGRLRAGFLNAHIFGHDRASMRPQTY